MLTVAGGIVLGFFAIVIILMFFEAILKFFAFVLVLMLFLAVLGLGFELMSQITYARVEVEENQLATKIPPWIRYGDAVVVDAPPDTKISP